MATEAQRLISISLAKIATSRCVRGGISLHKNLLVATVLQKARYIFMEEAFHMVHGHYINQTNSKLIQGLRHEKHKERNVRQYESVDERNESISFNDSELDLFSNNIDSVENLNFPNHSNCNATENMEDLSCDTNNEESHSFNSQDSQAKSSLEKIQLDVKSKICNRKRRNADFEINKDSSLLPPKLKQIKIGSNKTMSNLNENEEFKTSIKKTKNYDYNLKNITNSSTINSENSTNKRASLDFLSNDLSSTNNNHSRNKFLNVMMTPLDMSYSTSTNKSNLPISPISSSIDRITSLVSIFNFGNLQRSVSAPDLCSSSHHCPVDCCSLQQRQIAMSV
ncbi:unnamed protein product [Chironomus riparius]|uniref:Uncharacterized protein n=1 Tax=Chironomus riparius TaxID=315576 RepID=A0A9N9S302_9DIPT|nr:unnamed protein product [Chironomus riparius]